MAFRQNWHEQINQCVDAMNNIFYVQESSIFPKYNGEEESKRVAAVTKNVSIREFTCRKAECFHEFCRVFEIVIREIINNLEKVKLSYEDDRDFDIDKFMSSNVNPLNGQFQNCSCHNIVRFIEDYLKNKKKIEELKQEYGISKFFNRTVIYGRENEDEQWDAYADFLNKFIKRYVFNYLEKCEWFTQNWHEGKHNFCQEGKCDYAHSIRIPNIYAMTRSKGNNLCVLDEKAGFCFSDLRVIKKHLNRQYGLKYLLKHGSDSFVRYYIDSRIRPLAASHAIFPQMPYFAQVGKEILAYYLATEMKENLTADNHNDIKTNISWLYNDISLTLDNPIPKQLLLNCLYKSTYFTGAGNTMNFLYNLNTFKNLFNVLYTLTEGNMDMFNKFAEFIASVYAGRKIKSTLLDKQDKKTSSVYIFVTPNRTFVEEFLRDIFIPSPKQTYTASQGEHYEFDDYKHSLDEDNHVFVHHYTEYSLEQLCDKRYIGKFIEDQFYGHMLNVTSLNNNVDEDTLIKFNKLASGDVIEGENAYLGAQKYISNSTYAFILFLDKSHENMENLINTFEKCVPGVNLIILDGKIPPQIHLINKDEFNPINRSMFNNEEKLYMATKMVELGYRVHKFGTQYKECRTEDIIKKFLDTCGKFVDVPDGEENKVLSAENATTLKTFNEAFCKFYLEIKQIPFSKKFDKNNFGDYFKNVNFKVSDSDELKISKLYGAKEGNNLEIRKGYEGVKDKSRYVKGFVVEPLSTVKEAATAYAKEINSVQEPEVLSEYNFVEMLVEMLDNDGTLRFFLNEYRDIINDKTIFSPLPRNFKKVTKNNSQTVRNTENDLQFVQQCTLDDVDKMVESSSADKKKVQIYPPKAFGL